MPFKSVVKYQDTNTSILDFNFQTFELLKYTFESSIIFDVKKRTSCVTLNPN